MSVSRRLALFLGVSLLAASCGGSGGTPVITETSSTTTTTAATTSTTEASSTTAAPVTTEPVATTEPTATTEPVPDDPTPGVTTMADLAGQSLEDPFEGTGFQEMRWVDDQQTYLVSMASLTGSGDMDLLAAIESDPAEAAITGLGEDQILMRTWIFMQSGDFAPSADVLYTQTANGWVATAVIDTPSLDDALFETTDYRAVRPGAVDTIEVDLETFEWDGTVTFTALVEAFLGNTRFYDGEVECTIASPMECTILSDDGVLRIEDQGDEVEELQEDLRDAGYYSGAIDGDYGSGTQAAVMRFQTDYQLGVDGSVGSQTRDVLDKILAGTYPFLVASDTGVGYVPFNTPWQQALNTLTAGLGAPTADTGWFVDACDAKDWRIVSWNGFDAIFTDRSGTRIFDGWRVTNFPTKPSTVLIAHGLTTAWRWSDLAANGAEWEPFYGGVWRIAAWGFNAGRLQGPQPNPPSAGAIITAFGTGTGGFASC